MTDETTPQDSAAMPPASVGSQPVAWAVVYFDAVDTICGSRQDCERFIETQCRRDYMTAVPLYRSQDGEQEYGSLRAENERLRAAIRLLADQDATLSVSDGNVTVTMDGTLADDEREAIQTAAILYEQGAKQMGHVEDGKRAVALRELLERLG